MEIDKSVCVVTGASSGIGMATARLLFARGARVVLAARRIECLEALSAELPGSLVVPTDLTRAEQIERIVATTVATFGRLDVLVNSAGKGLHVPIEQLDPVDLRTVFELNVIAPIVGMQAVLSVMREQSAGAIVNVSSATSLRVLTGLGGYAATKAALNMLSQVARVEFADAGVAVSLVYPSLTATEFHDRLRAGHLGSDGGSNPPDPPELAAQAIIFAIESGETHVMFADPPRPITPGDTSGWGALLARLAPRADAAEAMPRLEMIGTQR